MSEVSADRRGVSGATVARLPEYLHVLNRLTQQGTHQVSSSELAAAVGVSPAQLRKDLSRLGSYGVRGVGYNTQRLAGHIAVALGLTHPWPVVVVGAGRLGQALGRYPGLVERGLRIAALFDVDPALVGGEVAGARIHDMSKLPEVIAGLGSVIGIIATPESAAAEACAALVDAGVSAILNFAPAVLPEPPGVHLRHVDVANELQILAFHMQSTTSASGSTGASAGASASGSAGASPAGTSVSASVESQGMSGAERG